MQPEVTSQLVPSPPEGNPELVPRLSEVTARPKVKKHIVFTIKKHFFFDLIQSRKVPIYNVGHE